LIAKVVYWLVREHYDLAPGNRLPIATDDPHHGRSYRFSPGPYLFQHDGRAGPVRGEPDVGEHAPPLVDAAQPQTSANPGEAGPRASWPALHATNQWSARRASPSGRANALRT